MGTREKLEAAADLAWESAQDSPPDKRGPLLAQYLAAVKALDAMNDTSAKASDSIDEIAQRRAARGASTATRARGATQAKS